MMTGENKTSALAPENARILSIDRFRGLIVFSMILFQLVDRFDSMGFLTRIAQHSVDKGIVIMPGMTLADIIAPMFFLAIGLNFCQSFRRRAERGGRAAAYWHFIARYLFIVGAGGLLDTCDKTFEGDRSAVLIVCIVLTAIAIASGLFRFFAGVFKKGTSRVAKTSGKIFLWVVCVLGAVDILVTTYNLQFVFWESGGYSLWGVLQAIGGAGLLALLFVEMGTLSRGITAGVLFLIFTFIHQLPGNMERIDAVVQGGIIGVLGWGAMLLGYTVIADLFYKDSKKLKYFLPSLPVLLALGVFGYFFLPINKGSVSPGYILVSMFISAFGFLIIALTGGWQPKFRPIVWWGKNPILMFLLQYLLVNVITSVIPGFTDLSAVLALIYAAAVTALITFIAYRLDKGNKIVKL